MMSWIGRVGFFMQGNATQGALLSMAAMQIVVTQALPQLPQRRYSRLSRVDGFLAMPL